MSKSKPFLQLLAALVFLAGSLFRQHVTSVAAAGNTPDPKSVTIAGTLQSELGCDSDWLPACSKTFLTYDAEDGIWQGTFPVSLNNDQDKKGPRYKAALNGAWDENYGKNAAAGGGDIPLLVTQKTQVKFFYDHKTHWITDNFNSRIVVALGDFQTQLGCKQDNDAGCLRSWLQDPEGSGTYSFVTRLLKKGTYSATLAFNEDPKNSLGAPQTFTVAADGDEIYFGYDTVKNELTLSTTGAPKGSLAKLKCVWVNQVEYRWFAKIPLFPLLFTRCQPGTFLRWRPGWHRDPSYLQQVRPGRGRAHPQPLPERLYCPQDRIGSLQPDSAGRSGPTSCSCQG
jgi:pullulanase